MNKVFVAALVLIFCPFSAAFSQDDGLRERGRILKARVAVDGEFKKAFPEKWKRIITAVFEKADREFLKQFGTRIAVGGWTEWESDFSDGPVSLENVLASDLKQKVALANNDFVAGFTGGKIQNSVAGIDRILGKYIVVSVNGRDMAQSLVHELGHFCGAGHSELLDSVMFPYYTSKRTFNFDEANKTLILNSFCVKNN